MKNVTRSKLIQMWFTAVVFLTAACLFSGVDVTAGTTAMLIGMSFVPPVILMMLWPGSQPLTAVDVLYEKGAFRR